MVKMTLGSLVTVCLLAINFWGLEVNGQLADCKQFTTARQTIDLFALSWPEKNETLSRLAACSEANRNINEDGKYFKHGVTGLMAAARFGFIKTVTSFVHLSTNLNAGDEAGNTPVILAAKWGHSNGLRLLLSVGADVDLADKKGFTPLYYYTVQSQETIILGRPITEIGDAGHPD